MPIILGIIFVIIYIPLWGWTVHVAHEQEQVHREDIMPVLGLEDSLNYRVLADNLIRHHVFSAQTSEPFIHETFRVPGYPFFAALIKAIAGSYLAVSFVQVILTFVTSLLIFFLGKKLHSQRVGFIAALLFIIDPVVVQYTLLMMSDILFVFLITLAVYIYLNGFTSVAPLASSASSVPSAWQALKRMASVGLILGMATLVRPISMYLIIPLVCLELFRNYSSVGWKKRIAAALCILVAFAACIVPWMIRNKVASGVLAVSSISTYNLFAFNLPGYYLFHDGIPESQTKEAFFREAGGINEDQACMLEYAGVIGPVVSGNLKEHFFSYAYFHIAKVTSFFFSSSYESLLTTYLQVSPYRTAPIEIIKDPHLSDLFARHEWVRLGKGLMSHIPALIERIFWGIMFLCACAAVWVYRRSVAVWMYAGLIAYFAVVTGPVANARYRLPGMPFLFLLAVMGIVALWPLLVCLMCPRIEEKKL